MDPVFGGPGQATVNQNKKEKQMAKKSKKLKKKKIKPVKTATVDRSNAFDIYSR